MVYFLGPTVIREMGWRSTEDQRQVFRIPFGVQRPKEETLHERQKRWDDLRDSIIENGFDPNQPITIMLNRKDGNRDQVFQGHHRLVIAIELQLSAIPVRFVTKKK